MDSTTISLKDAKARLSELTELASTGEIVIITKRGKPVVQLSSPEKPRKPVNLTALRRLTDSMPAQTEDAATHVRRMRDEARY